VSEISNNKFFEKDTLIFRQDEKAGCAYLIKSGVVSIYRLNKGKEVEVARLSSGEIFGEMALISRRYHNFNAQAHADCELVPIDPQILDEKIKNADTMVRSILTAALERLSRMDERTVKDLENLDVALVDDSE